MKPDEAANMLTIYEGKFTRLKDDRDNLIKAKEALELADPGESRSSEHPLLNFKITDEKFTVWARFVRQY